MSFSLPKNFRNVGFATIFFGALPFVIYGVESWTGLLASEEAWLEQGFNHGPWRWEAEGFTIAYPLAILALVTIVITVVRAVGRRQLQLIGAGIGLLVLQISIIALQLFTLFWLID